MSLEQLIVCHCSPVLTGIKPANLITCSKASYSNVEQEIKSFEKRFELLGFLCKKLCSCSEYILLYVYNVAELEKSLGDIQVQQYLTKAGYSLGSCSVLLEQLQNRVAKHCGFPHEIGIFLGYPLEDVIGFVENRGENCKYSGYWKVYGDIENAKKLFRQYEDCKMRCTKMAMNGMSLERIVRLAEEKSA